MELTEVPDMYYFERKQVLAMKGLTEGFRLFWTERVWADGIYCFECTQILEALN